MTVMAIRTSGTNADLRHCTKCATTKSISDFYTITDRRVTPPRIRFSARCKPCHIEIANAARERRSGAERERHLRKQRSRALQRIYGITLDEYDTLLERQSGRCAICGTTEPGRGQHPRSFSVDHNHRTGRVRGLLCHLCNTGIGALDDDPVRLRLAANYLEAAGV
jgi:hypothetical protein